MQREAASLVQILHAAHLINELVQGFDQTTFQADVRTWSAVLYQLAVIGEARRRLSNEFRASHPSVAWSGMIGLRNVIIHNYDTLDGITIWQIVQVDLPNLIAHLETILPQLSDDSASEQAQE